MSPLPAWRGSEGSCLVSPVSAEPGTWCSVEIGCLSECDGDAAAQSVVSGLLLQFRMWSSRAPSEPRNPKELA